MTPAEEDALIEKCHADWKASDGRLSFPQVLSLAIRAAVAHEREYAAGIADAEIDRLRKRAQAAEAREESIKTAAQAVVERWDTPLWKEAEHTGEVINRLRDAIRKGEPSP